MSCWTTEKVAVIMACDAISYATVQSLIWAADEGLTVARIAKMYIILC